MHSVEYTKTAQRQIEKFPLEIHERILATIERSRIRPEQHFERLSGEPLYKLRVGDYRVIAQIDNGKLLILVVKVGHRKNVYGR